MRTNQLHNYKQYPDCGARSSATSFQSLKPLHHGPRRLQVLAVVGEDLVHDRGSQVPVLRFSGLEVAGHRPLAACALERPFEADKLLDRLQSVVGERDNDRLVGDRQ